MPPNRYLLPVSKPLSSFLSRCLSHSSSFCAPSRSWVWRGSSLRYHAISEGRLVPFSSAFTNSRFLMLSMSLAMAIATRCGL